MKDTELKDYIKNNKPVYISSKNENNFSTIILAMTILIFGILIITVLASTITSTRIIFIKNDPFKEVTTLILILVLTALVIYQFIYQEIKNEVPYKKLKSIFYKIFNIGSNITYAKEYDNNTIIFVMNNQFYYLKIDTLGQSPEAIFKKINYNNKNIRKLKLSDLETIQVVKELSDNNFKTLDLKFKEIKKLEDQANLKLQQQSKLDQLKKEKNDLIKQLN